MRKDDYGCFVKSMLVMIFEIQIGLVCAIARNPVIIDTAAQALNEEISPGQFRGDFIPKRKRIAIEGNAGGRKAGAGGSTTIASRREFTRLWTPAEFPINSARQIVAKR